MDQIKRNKQRKDFSAEQVKQSKKNQYLK